MRQSFWARVQVPYAIAADPAQLARVLRQEFASTALVHGGCDAVVEGVELESSKNGVHCYRLFGTALMAEKTTTSNSANLPMRPVIDYEPYLRGVAAAARVQAEMDFENCTYEQVLKMLAELHPSRDAQRAPVRALALDGPVG